MIAHPLQDLAFSPLKLDGKGGGKVFIKDGEWVGKTSPGLLLAIAAAAIALILLLVIVFKLHAFLTLVVVSVLTAVAAGISTDKLYETVMEGFNSTLGTVGILVGLGAMLGKLVEDSGGAQALADYMIDKFGEKRAPMALGFASLLLGFPMFFDAGLVVMLPIVFAVARRLGGPILLYAFPTAVAFSVMHVFVPPHPGPVAASSFYGANLGYLMIVGVIFAIPTFYVTGVLWGRYCARKFPHIDISGTIFGGKAEPVKNPPRVGVVVLMLLLPMLLILLNTSVDFMTKAGMFGDYKIGANSKPASTCPRGPRYSRCSASRASRCSSRSSSPSPSSDRDAERTDPPWRSCSTRPWAPSPRSSSSPGREACSAGCCGPPASATP